MPDLITSYLKQELVGSIPASDMAVSKIIKSIPCYPFYYPFSRIMVITLVCGAEN